MSLAIGVSPIFYGLVLIAVVNLSKTLKYVISSVTSHMYNLFYIKLINPDYFAYK